MRKKGKLIKWHADRAFGFIQPNGGGPDVFMHKTALSNRQRIPKINDIITFSISQDTNGKVCAVDATFSGEKLKRKDSNKINKFPFYLSILFLTFLILANVIGDFPQKLLLSYLCFSVITFFAYVVDKSKAKRGAWRIQESTLHFFALIGGWPGAGIAQQLLRHKYKKRKFLIVYWFTVMINISLLFWFFSSSAERYLALFY